MGVEYKYSPENLSEIVDICKKRSTFTKDLQSVADIFFKPITLTDDQKKSFNDDYKKVFNSFITKDIDWNAESIKQTIFDTCNEQGVKMGKVMPSLRTAIAGGLSGPDLVSTMKILGKEESFNRIKNSL
jgi:glutamyl-tRNA synthetase